MKEDVRRFACQMSLEGFGIAGQKKLKKSKVLIVGLGGLGCPVSQYLTSSGIGTLGISDFDVVSIRNLHRQTLYGDSDVGKLKTTVAAKFLKRQNKQIKIVIHPKKITSNNALKIIGQYDIVVDCSDNFEIRYLLNDACVILGKPLVYGAIFQYEGQVAVWNVKKDDGTFSSNYRDVFPTVNSTLIPNCDTGGVIPTIAGIIGCVQATEVIKYITKSEGLLINQLFIFNARTMSSYSVSLPKDSRIKISSLENEAKVPTILARKLKVSLHKNKYVLIDVRSKEEHSRLNIGGKNIPIEKFLKSVGQFNFDKPTVIYCKTGIRSERAVRGVLEINPGAKIMSLMGGIEAW